MCYPIIFELFIKATRFSLFKIKSYVRKYTLKDKHLFIVLETNLNSCMPLVCFRNDPVVLFVNIIIIIIIRNIL